MVEKVRELVTGGSGTGLLAVTIVIVVLVLAAAVVMIVAVRDRNRVEPFQEMPDEQEIINPGPVSSYSGVFEEDDDKTRKLFQDPCTDLKSYQMELTDANNPSNIYRINMTDRIVLGRRSTCTICIPNHTLSGEHCEILLRDGRLFLHDLNSLNGTFIDGSQDRVKEEEVATGSRITMGQVTFIINIREVR